MQSAPLIALAAVLALFGIGFLVAGARRLRRRRLMGGALGATTGLLFLSLGALSLTLSVATQGYRAFTREELAATVEVRPKAGQTFDAVFTLPDGRESTFSLAGDQLYVDAHIVKWRPLANVLGLHTQYELDRVAGRYADLDDERSKPRTVFSLAREKRIDLFTLRRRWSWLSPVVDAEYGSATFITSEKPARFDVLVSTSGLLVRPR